jgi:hypothetical protein
MLKYYEHRAHTVALFIAVLGPLINLMIGLNYAVAPPGMYFYWLICLSIYIIILIPFTRKYPLTLAKLIFLGVMVEDFSSNVWQSLILGKGLLPFCNWYTEHFPFIGSLGEPTPLILIPRWYLVSLFLYIIIAIFQKRKLVEMRREI